MKDTDYRNIKGILDTIDSLTHSADEFKKMQEEIKNSEVRAKLFLNINGQTREIILSEKITELTLSESIKSCNDSVKKLKEGIDNILDDYLASYSDDSKNQGGGHDDN